MASMKMLVSDVDGTLLGDPAATRFFCDWWSANGAECRLVYSSGRFIESVAGSVRDHGLPAPSAIIGGVGTEIFDCEVDRRDLEWERRWQPSWDRDAVVSALSMFPKLELQPAIFQSASKVSYYLLYATPSQLHDVRRALSESRSSAHVVYSSDRDLDVLPRGVDKGTAAAYLARQWGIQPANVVACGDSGNDLSLFQQGFRGVVVANAHAELVSAVGCDTFMATQTYAAGVVEGLSRSSIG